MKDPVFTGKDVGEALRLASRTLSVAQDALRYVVLDPGSAGGRGLSPTEARIAVLFELSQPAAAAQVSEARVHTPRRATGDPGSDVREIVRRMAAASGQELDVELREGRDTLDVHLVGPGTAIFFDETGEALTALEYLFDRMYGRDLDPLRVRVTCAGFREHREDYLQRRARELAMLVRAEGTPRVTEPMNSYERRIVHVALEQEPGVTTYSVGEGRERRVTIAPSQAKVDERAARDEDRNRLDKLPQRHPEATVDAHRGVEQKSDPDEPESRSSAAVVSVSTNVGSSPDAHRGNNSDDGSTSNTPSAIATQDRVLPREERSDSEPTSRSADEVAATAELALDPQRSAPTTFDYASFNRPPEGHRAPELM